MPVTGEPGTGKTVQAQEIARAISTPLIEWNVKSTTRAQQGLCEYDAAARRRDEPNDLLHELDRLRSTCTKPANG